MAMNPKNILIWNVRGLNLSIRQDVVRILADMAKIDVVCLQETKMENVPHRLILSMLGSAFSHYIHLPSVGATGGILICWKDNLGAALSARVDAFSVSVQLSSAEGTLWWLTCVYGPQDRPSKLQFLQEIRDL